MSLRLIRETSNTPNITNKIDARMIRYAYGGENGILPYKNNFAARISDDKKTLIIDSGIFVFQGWEIEQESSWQHKAPANGSFKHVVYLEINLINETAELKTTYTILSDNTPTINPGDDLTQFPNGVARTELYYVESVDGQFQGLKSLCKKLEYSYKYISDIEKKLKNEIEKTKPKILFKNESGLNISSASGKDIYVVSGNLDNKILRVELGNDAGMRRFYDCRVTEKDKAAVLTASITTFERNDPDKEPSFSAPGHCYIDTIKMVYHFEKYGNNFITAVSYRDEVGVVEILLSLDNNAKTYDFASLKRTDNGMKIYNIWIIPEAE